MAKIFVDANIFIDLAEKRSQIIIQSLDKHQLFLSTLSVHILMYVTRKKIPYPALLEVINRFLIVDFDSDILDKALEGPTPDFEDNVQLHSAVEEECTYFLTSDQRLLKMGIFGKTRIVSSLNLDT